MRRTAIGLLLCATLLSAEAAESNAGTNEGNKINYMPEVHGVVRTRWEGEWASEEAGGFGSRFEVRNARLNVGGLVFPTVRYFVQIDACDQGSIKFLDAWARWEFLPGWRVQGGQFRVPFGVDCFKAPGNYLFANRSFIGKDMVNMRQVGAKVGYYGYGRNRNFPVDVEAGMFNTASTGNHNVWQHAYTYAAIATWHLSHNVALSGSFVSYEPDAIRVNVADGALTWQTARWHVEGEYQYKRYAGNSFQPVNAWNFYTTYTLPLKTRILSFASFEGRFDGIEAHSTGTRDAEGKLIANTPARRRLTLGSTIGRSKGALKAEFRINYEKYFYCGDIAAPRGGGDKLLAEVTLKF